MSKSINQIRMKVILLFVFTLLLFTKSSKGQIITNPGFESWPPFCPYNVAPNGWINFSTSLGPDQAGTCAGMVTSFQGNSHMNLVWTNAGLREGTKQAISGLVVGETYNVKFYAIHDQGLYASNGSVILSFYHNSTLLFSTPELFSGGSWTPYNVSFTAISTIDTIGFQVEPGTTGTSGSVGVDADSTTLITNVTNIDQETEFNIYPNPFVDIFTLSFLKSNYQNKYYSIQNLLGLTIVHQQELNSSNRIVVKDLPKGVYILNLYINDNLLTKKIIKQ